MQYRGGLTTCKATSLQNTAGISTPSSFFFPSLLLHKGGSEQKPSAPFFCGPNVTSKLSKRFGWLASLGLLEFYTFTFLFSCDSFVFKNVRVVCNICQVGQLKIPDLRIYIFLKRAIFRLCEYYRQNIFDIFQLFFIANLDR